MLDLADLRAFVRIADLGGISAAARALSLPKSTVSRSLVRLEEAMGAVLVERSTRHLRLTDAGQTLRVHARRVLDEVAAAEDAVAGLAGEPRGDLRVTAPFTLAVGPIAAMMPDFVRRHPQVRVAIAIDNRIVDMIGEEYDVAVRVGPLADSGLIAKRLTDVSMWLCASPGYLSNSPPVRSPRDLAAHRLLSHGHGPSPWRFDDLGGALAGLSFEAQVAVPEPDALLAMMAGDAGIGLLPDFTAASAIADRRLVRLLVDLDFGSVPVHALFAGPRGSSPKVSAFVDALSQQLSRQRS